MAARWSAPSGAQWTIRCRAHQATVVEVGGGLREYTVDGEHVVEPYAADAVCAKAAGQILAPWPNRIGGGQYTFGGETHQLPINEVARGNATHGLSRWQSWHRVDQTPESVTLSCIVAPQPGYPHPIELVVRWSVGDEGLRAEHTAVNLGTRPAPFGLGAHPYLRVGPAATLELPGTEALSVDSAMLPTGRAPVAGTDLDFTTARPIAGASLDTAFTGLVRDEHGIARTRLTGVELWQDRSFGWVQVYNGVGPTGAAEAVAVEPMTCPPDAFRSGDDLLILDPGARWSGSWGITPLP
jgi:aldose 1-epimerase